MKIYRTILSLFFAFSALFATAQEGVWQSDAIALYKENILLANKAAKTLVMLDQNGVAVKSLSFDNAVTGVAVFADKAYVTTTYAQGMLHRVDLSSFKVESSVATAMGAKSPTIDASGEYVYVCNQYKGTVTKVSAKDMKVVASGDAIREPFASVLSKDGRYLFVNNFLPHMAANLDYVASDVSVFDTQTMKPIKSIKLDNGTNALRGIAISEDGRYVFISHNLGRFQVPTSQLQQGWMNTSAVSVVSVENLEFVASVLLDEPERGAAGIYGIACDSDNIIITHSGTHDISVVPYAQFVSELEAYPSKLDLSYDLYFMYKLRKRVNIVGNGPRNLTLKDGVAYIPTYFSDTLNVYNIASGDNRVVAYNPNRKESSENIGEKYFNDASYCFQNWQSCNGCHPGDARTDGMNWDLMNDGIGNSKNCKSMLYSHVTAPAMISGIREKAEIAVRKGFELIQFINIDEQKSVYVDDYLKALRPLPSPYLVDGELSEKAKKGRLVFDQLGCGLCHSGPYYTDQQMHRIGDNIEFEKGWDTPTLVEVWRTGPYLFEGQAVTMFDVFKTFKHGINGEVSDSDLEALSEYVLSL